jgi:hypothetical protein
LFIAIFLNAGSGKHKYFGYRKTCPLIKKEIILRGVSIGGKKSPEAFKKNDF